MAEAIDTAFVEIVPDFRNFGPQVQDGIRRSTRAGGVIRPTVDPKPAQAGIQGITRQLGLGSNAATLFGSNISRAGLVAGAGVAGIGLAAGLAVGKITHAGIEFESAFAGVRKTVSASSQVLDGIRKDFIDLSTEIPVTTTELSAIGEEAGALGIQTKGITDFTKTVAELGVTTNLTSEVAADALARLANITQLPQDEFDNLGSTIVALGNKTAATEAEIVDFGLRISGAGQQIGLTQDQILAFGAALASVGLNAEAGGTAISTTFIKIARAVEKGGKQLDAFAAVSGQSATEFATQFRTAPAQAISDFLKGLGRIKADGGSVFTTLDQLGLGGIRVRDALLRAAGAGDLLDRSLQVGATSWQKNNALQKEAQQRFSTTASQIQLAKNQVSALAIELSGPLVKGTGDAAQGFAFLIGKLREGVGALKTIGGSGFDATNADLDELAKHLSQVADDVASAKGTANEDFITGQLGADAQKTVAQIRQIAKALNDTPAGLSKFVRIFSANSNTIRQAMADGIIDPAEQAQLEATQLGREFIRALPPNMFQQIPGAAKSAIEDTVASIRSGTSSVAIATVSMIEDASRQAVQAAAAGGTKIGDTLAASIAASAQKAVQRSNVITGVQDEAVDAAIASGSTGAQLAALRKKRDALANAIGKIEQIKNPGKARVDQRRELRSKLAATVQQIEGIEGGIVADQQAAAQAAKTKAAELKTTAEQRDRDFVSGIESTVQRGQNRVTEVSGDNTLRNDLAANIELKKILQRSIDLVKDRVKDAKIKRDTLDALRGDLKGVVNDIAANRKEITANTREAAQAAIGNRGDLLSEITEIASLREDESGQKRGLQAEIAFWRRVALGAKKGSKAQRDAILTLEQKKADLANLVKGAKTSAGGTSGTSLADLFSQQTGITRGAGFDVGPQISGQVTQPIEDEVFRRLRQQGATQGGKLAVDAALTGSAKADPQIDRLIAALVANTAAVSGNTTASGSPGLSKQAQNALGQRGVAMARFYQAQRARKLREDTASA